jgi:N-acetylglucosamine kinase-like BadF-type ATPase
MRFVLGVDGGATKTHALIVDEAGQAVGFGQAGTSNHQANGLEPALRQIEQAVKAALAEASLDGHTLDTGYFCLAGADLPEDYRMIQPALENLGLVSSVTLKNDTMAALRAGISRPWGVAVICGTGFNAAGRSPDGREIQLAGLGFISGDWGGGSALVEEVIRAVMRAWDGRGQPTLLTGLVLDAIGVPDEQTMLAHMYRREIPIPRLHELVPLLFEAAWQGDDVAHELIVRLGVEVGVTATALIRRLDLAATDVEVVLGGSVFKGRGPLLVDTVRQTVHQVAPQAQIVPLRHEPVFGAALLALEAAGGAVTPQIRQRLDRSLRRLAHYPAAERG